MLFPRCRMTRWPLILAAVSVLPGAALARPVVGTEAALRMLLAASALWIPPASSCYGIIPGLPQPKLGDFLATPLAALDSGTNRVTGGCEQGQCRVRITHSAGEDVFSSEYRFRTARGRLVPASLRCFSTP